MKKIIISLLFILVFGYANYAISADIRANPTSKIYHFEKCQHYKGKGVTVKFNSVEEAQKNGFSPCKICYSKSEKTAYIGNMKSKIFHKSTCTSEFVPRSQIKWI